MTGGPTSYSFISQRLRLNYLDWGNPELPPLLLIHGSRDHARSWDAVAERLRYQWRVIALDLRGHGDSDWSNDGNYPLLSHVYDMAELIDQRGLAPVTIIAHSMGGAVALRYASLFPDKVRRLVDVDGANQIPEHYQEIMSAPAPQRILDWFEQRRAIDGRSAARFMRFEDAIERMRVANSGLSDAQVSYLALHAVRQNEDGTYSWKFDPYAQLPVPIELSEAERFDMWAKIQCPILLCWGRRSWTSDPAENGLVHMFKDARSAPFDGGHWLHHDCLDAFMAVIIDFLIGGDALGAAQPNSTRAGSQGNAP